MSSGRYLQWGCLATAFSFACLGAGAAEKEPVVVELFTSQGCSSCPPANANLLKLAQRPGVLALSFSVTYWDRLGWKDIFGKPEFTDRQYTYEPMLGEAGPFTPQIVIDGSKSAVGNNLAELETLIGGSKRQNEPAIAIDQGEVTISAAAMSTRADIWMVRYESKVIDVPVARGENSGRTLPHANVVRDLLRIGEWSGKKVTAKLPANNGDLRIAVLVQIPNGGPILSAATK